MGKVDDVLWWAASQIGYCASEDPEPGSRYGRWMAEKTGESWLAGPSSEIWWCCCFASWCLDRAGATCQGFPTYNTDVALRYCGDARLANIYDAQPGDLIIFNWDNNSSTDHIGIVEANHGSWLQTIEGNVFNSVMRVTRDWSYVAAVIRPDYESEQPSKKADPDIRFMQLMVNTQLSRRGNDDLIDATGVFDWRTMVPIIEIAQDYLLNTADMSISIDGNWSDELVGALNDHPIRQGMSCAGAWAVKAALIGQGYKGACLDLSKWDFSAGVAATVRMFQESRDMTPTGVVDSDTLFALTHEK